jgi:Protein tyrosine and serine/threonine kinase
VHWLHTCELPDGLEQPLFQLLLSEDVSLDMIASGGKDVATAVVSKLDDRVRLGTGSVGMSSGPTAWAGKPLTMGARLALSKAFDTIQAAHKQNQQQQQTGGGQGQGQAGTANSSTTSSASAPKNASASKSMASTDQEYMSMSSDTADTALSSFDRKLLAADFSSDSGSDSDRDRDEDRAEWESQVAKTKQSLTQALGPENTDSWLIDHADLEFIRELGEGSSGKVFRGLYRNNRAAIKVLATSSSSSSSSIGLDGLAEFRKEFEVLHTVRSKYIVGAVGACFEPQVCIVMDYCARGSLHGVLGSRKHDIRWEKAFKFAIETMKGLQCLHNWAPPIIHRDLKPLNVLLTEYWECKLCDFGTARFKTATNMKTLNKLAGTYTFLAPEAFLSSGFTEKSDIYAYGVMLWEICERVLSGRHVIPYSEFADIVLDVQIATRAADRHLRPTIHRKCPKALATIIRRCWAPEPAVRPTANELEPLLLEQQRIYKANKEAWYCGPVVAASVPASAPPVPGQGPGVAGKPDAPPA